MYASTWNGRGSRCFQNELGSSYLLWYLGPYWKAPPNSFKTVLEVKEQYFQMESWNKYKAMQTYKVITPR